jgi:Tol biopolymer transport system component
MWAVAGPGDKGDCLHAVNKMKNFTRQLIHLAVIATLIGPSLTRADRLIPQSRVNELHLNTNSHDYRSLDTPAPARGSFNGKLAFSSDRHNSGLSIWTMNVDGSSVTRLTTDKARTANLPPFVHVREDSPSWSPDGTRIAFISNRNSIFSLYVMNADGTNPSLITDRVPSLLSAVWSPDGQRIAVVGGTLFAADTGNGVSDIYLINVNDGTLTKLTNDSGFNLNPAWSPDGRQIVFSSNRDADGRSKLWVMNADGSSQRRLTDVHNAANPIFYGDTTPSWSPDGTKILFTGSRDFNGTRNCFSVNCSEIFVMNSDGTNDGAITNDPNRGGVFQNPRWSPDGTKIVTSLQLGTINDVKASIDLGRAIIVMNADGSNSVNLSNRTDHAFFDVSPDWQPLSAPAISTSSILGFSTATYAAFEDSGSIKLTVNRTGNLNNSASCSYRTQDGTATLRNDYGPVLGTLHFAAGESSKIISIPLTDSGTVRSSRSFTVTLSDNEGNATFIGGIRQATVTVLDRDTTPRPKSPIDDTVYLVRQHYVDFLNREPDADGLAFWTNEIESCGGDAQCREVKRINVSAAFYLSIEFQETGFFFYRFNLLNPYPTDDTLFLATMRAVQEIGQGVQVGRPGWEDRLRSNKLAFVQRYYDDDRLVLSFGRTNTEWIDLLFQNVKTDTGIDLSPAKHDALIASLDNGTETRPSAFVKVLDDPDFRNALFNQVFVLMQYYGYLRRDPDQDGFNFWLNKLNQFNGDFINAEMVKAFITSSEYRGRFGLS